MFDQILKSARTLAAATSPPEAAKLLAQNVPDQVTIEGVKEFISHDHPASDACAVLQTLYATLTSGNLDDADGSKESLEYIALQVGHLMEPVCSGASFDEDSTDYESISRSGELGLHVIGELSKISRHKLVLPPRALLSIVAYTNPEDTWSSSSLAEKSRSLISAYFDHYEPGKGALGGERQRFVTEDALTGFLRPLFVKSRPTTVTASGRPAAFPEPPSRYAQGDGFGGAADDVTNTKPWKYARRYAVTVFEWAVDSADTELLQQHWPLYTPVLLTLLDEPEPTWLKRRSLSIFRTFWARCPEGLLSRIGLTDVFEQAVFPVVLSLPRLTPETESLALLGAAYPALFDMAGVLNSDAGVDGDTKDAGEAANNEPAYRNQGFTDAQRKLLDKIVREGIMVGYHHAKENIRLVDFLCKTLRSFVSGIGIISVKYLKDIMPLVTEILTDPFGTKYPQALLSATLLLQEVLQTCWPRAQHYCNVVIRCIMICWLNIEDDDSLTTDKRTEAQLKQHLARVAETLFAIMAAAKLDISDRLSPLVGKEPRLRSLFSGCKVG
ncbi:hypothetical protein GGS20DRAFT_581455 [Poronia punctata]|nr:hypothetical protein GGS20DRAFT_581455 [Poronia punctata]